MNAAMDNAIGAMHTINFNTEGGQKYMTAKIAAAATMVIITLLSAERGRLNM